LSKKANIFAKFFGENILKIIISWFPKSSVGLVGFARKIRRNQNRDVRLDREFWPEQIRNPFLLFAYFSLH
jgi:hypothetical protein